MIKKDKGTKWLLLISGIYNCCVYYGGKVLSSGVRHYNIETAADKMIPLIPWTIAIYLLAYISWFQFYYLGIKYDKSGNNRFFIAHIIGEGICFFTFILFPTTMSRVEITGSGFFDRILSLTYSVDSPDNLLPSIHCFVSWLCFIGVRNNPDISKPVRWSAFIIAIAVCVSTLTVKQHVIADVFAGVALAELSYLIAGPVARTKAFRWLSPKRLN